MRVSQSDSRSRLISGDGKVREARRAVETHGSVEIAMRIFLQICGEGERAVNGACIAGPAGTVDGWNEVGEKSPSVAAIAGTADRVTAADGDSVCAAGHGDGVRTVAFSNGKIDRLLIDSAGSTKPTSASFGFVTTPITLSGKHASKSKIPVSAMFAAMVMQIVPFGHSLLWASPASL